MMNHRYSSLTILLLMIGAVVASESYLDYDETADRYLELLQVFYKALLRCNCKENRPIASPFEHLMTRKSQRSPSLRLRFGRSWPPILGESPTRQDNSQSTSEVN